jgi:hypothetical protein
MIGVMGAGVTDHDRFLSGLLRSPVNQLDAKEELSSVVGYEGVGRQGRARCAG